MDEKALISILLCTDGKWVVIKEKCDPRICATWTQVELALVEILQIPSAIASCETDRLIDGMVKEVLP